MRSPRHPPSRAGASAFATWDSRRRWTCSRRGEIADLVVTVVTRRAKQEREVSALIIGCDQVRPSVPVQVRRYDVLGAATRGEGRGWDRDEAARAVAEQEDDPRVVGREGGVEPAVAVQVAEGDPPGAPG